MSDYDTSHDGARLDDVARMVARMAADQEKLRAENEDLAARLRRLEGRPPDRPAADASTPAALVARTTVDDPGLGPAAEGGGVISRRGAFKTFGAAAAFAGAGAAVGSTLFGGDPAGATVSYVQLSDASNPATATTGVSTSSGYGLSGSTTDAGAAGVYGADISGGAGVGVKGQSNTGTAVIGYLLGHGAGAVLGEDLSGQTTTYGMSGSSLGGIGVMATGGRSQLFLSPIATSGQPTTGLHTTGEIYLDAQGRLFVCVGSGTPGTWQRMTPAAPGYNNTLAGSIGLAGSVNLLSAPIRVFDSRLANSPADPSRAAKPLTSSEADVALQITGTTVGGVFVPANSVGVIGNVTAVNPAGLGALVLYPEGQTLPTVSNLNYQSATIANYCIVALNPANGQIAVHVLGASTDVLFDVTGFIFGVPPIFV